MKTCSSLDLLSDSLSHSPQLFLCIHTASQSGMLTAGTHFYAWTLLSLCRQFLTEHKDLLLPADLVLSADGRQISDTEGSLTLGLRCGCVLCFFSCAVHACTHAAV